MLADESRIKIMAEITETPEFKEAVGRAAAEAIASLIKDGAAPAPGLPSDKAVLSALAVQLAELTGQGSGRRYVDPAILQQRAEAREHMVDLILAARENNTPPAYQLKQKVLLDFQLVDPFWIGADHVARPTEIDWYGVPNEVMVPVNGVAQKIHDAFMASIGSTEKVVPEQALGVTYNGLTVKGQAAANPARAVAPTGFGETLHQQHEKEQSGLSIHHKGSKPAIKPINVLGTIAQPAQQNA